MSEPCQELRNPPGIGTGEERCLGPEAWPIERFLNCSVTNCGYLALPLGKGQQDADSKAFPGPGQFRKESLQPPAGAFRGPAACPRPIS